MLKSRNILDLEGMDVQDMKLIMETAVAFKEVLGREIKKVPTLRGKSVVNLFYEPSTRTRSSFELAGKYLSADVINFSKATSSVAKGETLKDTAKTIEMMGVQVVVIRHPAPGAPHMLARYLDASVVNAGDGAHEHPTQALLDLFTIKEKKARIEGLKVAIIGDILHSRVARSNIWGLKKMGAEIAVAGPRTLLPPFIEELGVKAYAGVEDAIEGADVVNILRIQMERQKRGLFPSSREYAIIFGVNAQRLKLAKKDVLLMHPGPMNRGIEISSDIADGESAAINDQVTNGVAVRMAILYLLNGGGKLGEKGN